MPHGGYRNQFRDERSYERSDRTAGAQRDQYNRQYANPDESYFEQDASREQPDFDRPYADRGYGYEYNQQRDHQQRYAGPRAAQRRGYAGQSGVHEDDEIYGEQFERQRPYRSASYEQPESYLSRHSRGRDFEPAHGPERHAEQRYNPRGYEAYGQGGYRYGASPPPDQLFEPDYVNWREEQLGGYDRQFQEWRRQEAKKYDSEYAKWRQERQDKFNRDFSDWRKSLDAKPGATATASGTLHASKDDDKSDKAKTGRTTTM